MDRSSRQKINNEIVGLNDTLDQLDLIDIYRIFHPKTAECTFFSSARGMISRIDHMLGHKTSLNKFKRTEISSSIFFHPQLYETRNQLQEKNGKNTNTERVNNMLRKKQWVNEEIKEEIRKHLNTNEN